MQKKIEDLRTSIKKTIDDNITGAFINAGKNWEDLHTDCLIKIFGRVGLESLILTIPFVCKSWYKASLDPHCWKVLDFKPIPVNTIPRAIMVLQKMPWGYKFKNLPDVTPSSQFMKTAVNRSGGLATEVVFHTCLLRDNILEYILERCPALKTLSLPEWKHFVRRGECLQRENDKCLLKMISKLHNLESLMTLNIVSPNLTMVLNQLHIHCPNLVTLGFQDVISDDIASAIVTLFPNIKNLVLRGSSIWRESLILILSGCRKLELLDVSGCIGFDANDAEILKMASHIKTFKSEGAARQWELSSMHDVVWNMKTLL
ncbi:hypothetical protein AQUCO_02700244v1 [Aquilegia coerulea]|uniref:F-box domain-containing protein n=1 Tax=Aquilegia coerulea TaxID=218851 RepID=A0A2G5D5Y1_AQUCA|nr:hypothetical protein AQUCO_02700244v1 [Aquilegia coerulea]